MSGAYASPIEDLLQQVGAMNQTSEMSSSGEFKDLLLGVLFGNLLNRILNLPTDALTGGGNSRSQTAQKELIGFYAENWADDKEGLQSFKQHGDQIQNLSPFWGTINADGTITGKATNNREEVMRYAKEHNVKVTVLLNNAKGETGINPVHQLLNNEQRRTNAVANIEAYLKNNGFSGVNIDFELVQPEDRDNLTLFIQELASRLRPAGYTVAVSVFPKSDETTNDVAIAYDYQNLAKHVDQVILMTYDNHGEWSGPGPIADIRWVERNLKYALQFMPKNKLYLGIAGYGYDWSVTGVTTLHYKNVMETVAKYGSSLKWDEQAKVPYFTYVSAGVEHQVWFENSSSLAYKLDLVNKYDLKGIALWRLGQEDPAYWQVLRDKLR
jgi:spore germination protein YaaH